MSADNVTYSSKYWHEAIPRRDMVTVLEDLGGYLQDQNIGEEYNSIAQGLSAFSSRIASYSQEELADAIGNAHGSPDVGGDERERIAMALTVLADLEEARGAVAGETDYARQFIDFLKKIDLYSELPERMDNASWVYFKELEAFTLKQERPAIPDQFPIIDTPSPKQDYWMAMDGIAQDWLPAIGGGAEKSIVISGGGHLSWKNRELVQIATDLRLGLEEIGVTATVSIQPGETLAEDAIRIHMDDAAYSLYRAALDNRAAMGRDNDLVEGVPYRGFEPAKAAFMVSEVSKPRLYIPSAIYEIALSQEGELGDRMRKLRDDVHIDKGEIKMPIDGKQVPYTVLLFDSMEHIDLMDLGGLSILISDILKEGELAKSREEMIRNEGKGTFYDVLQDFRHVQDQVNALDIRHDRGGASSETLDIPGR